VYKQSAKEVGPNFWNHLTYFDATWNENYSVQNLISIRRHRCSGRIPSNWQQAFFPYCFFGIFVLCHIMHGRPNYLAYFCVFVLWCVIILFNVHLFIVKLVMISFLFIIRPHRSNTYADAAYCYRPSSVVCPSVGLSLCLPVCRSVCHTSEPCKNGCTNRAAVWVHDLGGPGNHVLDGGPDPPWEGVNFWGRMGVPL